MFNITNCRETQWESTIRYHYIPNRMINHFETNNTKGWLGCGARRTHVHCWWECNTVKPLWENSWVSFNVKHTLNIWPVALLDVYPREMITYVPTKTCIWMFVGVLYTSKVMWQLHFLWKKCKCTLVNMAACIHACAQVHKLARGKKSSKCMQSYQGAFSCG